MKIKKLIILIATFGMILGSTMAFGEGEKTTASADVGIFTRYIWRGFELSDDSIVFQPSVTIGYKGFSMNLWGNLDSDLEDNDPTTNDKAELNETDLTLAYDTSFGPVELGVGYIYYGLDSIDDSQELYLSAGLDVPLSPTLTVYREIAHLPGWYIHFGISHSFQLPKEITLDLSGSAGYYHSDDDEFDEVDNAFNPKTEKYRNLHDGTISIGLTVPFAKYFTFSPIVVYSFPLSNEADNLLTSASLSIDSDFIYGGFTLSFSF